MPILVFLLLLLCLSCKDADTTIPSSTLITNVQIIDGTGSPAFKGAVRINADKIEAIGNLEALKGEVLIDGKGMVLAPGFIDTHSHHDQDFQQKNRLVPGVFFKRSLPEIASQGVTSIIVGQDGSSNLPIKDFWEQLDSLPVAVNIGSYAGHNSIRKKVMGANYKRPATTEEIQKMKVLIEQEMQAGALGLSTGLEYDPGIYSTPEEVLALTSVLKSYKGRYISHMRSEDRHLETAIDELINIGKTHTIPVQISHFKLARVSLWQKADLILAKLDSARAAGIQVTADIYPYEYWQSTLAVLFPERDFTDLAAAKYALSELTTPEGVIISGFPDSSYIGKTLAEIADLRKESPEKVCLDLIKEAEKAGSWCFVMAKSMHASDIKAIINWSATNICSDGGLGDRHPRGAGSFTRILRKYCREEKSIGLAAAIQKMTSNAADNIGLKNRGRIQQGYYADLVLFNPDEIADHATFANPAALSTGVQQVWVNGQTIWADGKASNNYPGVALKVHGN